QADRPQIRRLRELQFRRHVQGFRILPRENMPARGWPRATAGHRRWWEPRPTVQSNAVGRHPTLRRHPPRPSNDHSRARRLTMSHEQGVVMRWLRWIIGTAVALVLIWAGYWAVAIYALNRAVTECSNEILQEATSTDDQYVATAFERNCGATAPFVRIVSLR